MLMPITPARVKSPVRPETGNRAFCTKSTPAEMRSEPGGIMSTSSVISGRFCALATIAQLSAMKIACAVDLTRLDMTVNDFLRIVMPARAKRQRELSTAANVLTFAHPCNPESSKRRRNYEQNVQETARANSDSRHLCRGTQLIQFRRGRAAIH